MVARVPDKDSFTIWSERGWRLKTNCESILHSLATSSKLKIVIISGFRCRKNFNPKSNFFVILIIITLTYQSDPWCYEKWHLSWSQGCDLWSHPLADLWCLILYTLLLPWLKGWTFVFLILKNLFLKNVCQWYFIITLNDKRNKMGKSHYTCH